MYKIKEYEDKYDKKVNSFIISIFVEEYGFEEYRKELEEQCYSEYMEQNGKLWIAIDEDENVGAMFFVILPGLHPDNLGYDLNMEKEQLKLCAMKMRLN